MTIQIGIYYSKGVEYEYGVAAYYHFLLQKECIVNSKNRIYNVNYLFLNTLTAKLLLKMHTVDELSLI